MQRSTKGNRSMKVLAHETRGQRIARTMLATSLLALGVVTIQSFLPALAWAAVFAISIWPLFWRAERRYPPGRHNLLLPSLFTLAVALIFVAPMVLAAVQLKADMHGALIWLESVQRNGLPQPDWLARLPVGAAQAKNWWARNLSNPANTSELLRRTLGDAVVFGRSIGSQLAHRLALFGFTLLTLFFLFRHGTRLSQELVHASQRLFGPRGEEIGRQMVASVHGTVSGLVLVGVGEGVLMGIAYALASVPQAGLLGAVTAIAAMIPFGAIVAFGFSALLLVAQGDVGAALSVFGFGCVVLFLADHLVRPVLIGGATRLPFLWVIFGILGGVEVWGLVGLFVGPAIMSALILLWRELAEEAPMASP
jgi:predicted PurR-regulated permease PerM